jgi:Fe-S-cluster-containing hydrogenase component 2/CRP-like cAMP-binding protein
MRSVQGGAVRREQRGEANQPGDGLPGQWLSLDELGQIELFKGSKRAFKVKLNTNLSPVADRPEPGIKAVVRREYQKGDVICKAGDYGSTAFLILEGSATAIVPERAAPASIPGRTSGSLGRLRELFRRRTRRPDAADPDPGDFGEVSAFASASALRPPAPQRLGPGDVFGIDTCINFYPRELTVCADERCVVLEMLRSVLDTIREAGAAGDRIEQGYRSAAVRNALRTSALLRDLSDAQLERLAAAAELLTPDSDRIRDQVVYGEGDAADAVYLVRAGTIKLSQRRAGGEFVFTYLGRGAAFGLESLVPTAAAAPLLLTCPSHPALFPPRPVQGTLTLGRSSSCDVVFPAEERAVSKRHCRLEARAGEVRLIDLDSANYTLLNGERIREALVTAGDRITVVDYTFELTRAPADTAAVPPRRLATAAGLDNFEIVRLPIEALRPLARENAALLQTALGLAGALEARAPHLPAAEHALVGALVDLNLYNSQNTLLIDLDRCTRCDECVRACADAHGGVARFTRDGPRIGRYLVTMACRSCTDPKCMIGCPVSSIRRRESLEVHIEDWCIGCERCANQCPFGNINMMDLAAAAPAAGASNLKATVCDLCAGYDGPSCVYACPHDAAIRVNPARFFSAADLG